MNKFFTIVISIALLSFFGYFYIHPSYIEWQDNVKELEDLREKVSTRNEYFTELRKIDQRLNEYDEELAKLDDAIPNRLSFPRLYDFLQKKGAGNGLVVQEISGKEIKQENSTSSMGSKKLNSAQISLSVLGSYSSIKDYIKELENSVRLFSIESLSVKTSKEKEGEDQQEGKVFPSSIKLKVYYY